MRLTDLSFSDLFVGPTNAWSWYKQTSASNESSPIPAEYQADLDVFRAHLVGLGDSRKDLRTTWPVNGGETLRVKRKAVAEGITLFIVRRFRATNLRLGSVGLQAGVTKVLLSDHPLLRGGIVAFLGRTGSGKSTLARAFMLDRLREFGGAAWTIENPIEAPLQGPHGKGWLYQIEVDDDDQIGGEIRELYRAVPNIVMIGEVRDSRTAREVVRAAGSGYLVIITFHGNDLASSIGQFVRLATAGDVAATASDVADVLRAAIYLELHKLPIQSHVKDRSLVSESAFGEPPQALSAQPLFFLDKTGGARNWVRTGEYHQLANEIDRQRRALMSNSLKFEA